MQVTDLGEGLGAFALAVLLATFGEYAVHRLMHAGIVLGEQHARHHREGDGQGWCKEFLAYFLPSVVILWIGFLYSLAAGIGFAAGVLFFTAWAAYSHQLQHERPELVFWLPRPVHHLHHEHKMWHHNFGIAVDFWDRVFGTYKVVEWSPEKRPFEYSLRSFWRIKWF